MKFSLKDQNNNSFAKERQEFAEIDFSSLLDFPMLSPSVLHKTETKHTVGEKYIVFHLDEKLYGIRTDKILEIAASLPITPIPNINEWFMGIANLRGMLISVVNLRKLWKKPAQMNQKSKLIIFQAAENDISIAFMVDKVSEIVTIPASEINFSASDFENSFPTFFGKAVFKSQPLFLLDIEKTLSTLKLDSISQ
jgi:purine-binding chemotaxis protein CheW